MKPNWIAFNLADGGKVGRIDIRGIIGEWWDVNDMDVSAQLREMGDVEDIDVRINSRGGEIDPAVAVFNLLRAHPAKVTVRIEGLAASAATIIAMAGDEIIMPANTLMMIHNPLSWAGGEADDLRAAADVLDTYRDAIVETYKARTGMEDDELKALMSAETWMTAREAVELGFADRVEELSGASATTALAAFASAMTIPADVLAKVSAIEAESVQPNDESEGGDPASAEASGDDAASVRAETLGMVRAVIEAAGGAGLAQHAGLWFECEDQATALACIEEARQIKALCDEHKLPALADSLIASRTPAATARSLVLQARAARDEAVGEINPQGGSPRANSGRDVSVRSIYTNLNANVR